ncbi:hypothetical protein FIT92_04125 [Candidatus Methylopumilus universalis]|uniref:DUF288 domain-containing protein n=1 Tax=Candidatus Methylopumilus universalis TaxID=2588536 RepID=A0AAX1EZI8_9PROT|nr:hypothetical protein [Candidatus Methylopumilus universalis]QDC41248.1 hypothetical protein FIT94_04125 [Candidatus Methylopumilus universalis]QDC42538.1 hypothetical protein FIT95_04130 [Candidatus Methylopumilus universalis]QDC54924.1 hypothetical protein FIT97_04125 [Candidatus Methylopumilus universalis]QDC56205.1 hypothetical protein FIT98_04130 [Candidatus Methylopumilus universalis]QDC57487.1 hypothetical protein FIT96_04125 [Candidatus Methylopumilus universalis]
MNNKKFIVITSINPPTDAVREFAKWSGWTTVVVGDRKSPKDWACENVVYLSIEDQLKLFPEFANFIPENTYLRKMFGYLYAFRNGAEAIFESDDDNIPYPDSSSRVDADIVGGLMVGETVSSSKGWVNIYSNFGAKGCWPRGYPLGSIAAVSDNNVQFDNQGLPWGVMQYLADEDPDVDAIYRMTHNEPVFFARNRTFRLAKNNYCPFNSQATLWLPELYPLMFLPVGKTDRVTDILRGYMSLSSLWSSGFTLAYSSPVVYQRRNFHDLLRDFELELDLYKFSDKWCRDFSRVTGENAAGTFLSLLELLVETGDLPDVNLKLFEIFSKECLKGLGRSIG